MQRDYGLASRVLHRAALGVPAILKCSFELESLLHDVTPSSDGRHVFIAGLARAGTTWLLRSLYASNQYQCLTYRHMPFVLMPNTWRQLSRYFQTQMPDTERAHGDGIMVNFDSPEAFEEVFWRTFSGPDYMLSDRLIPQEQFIPELVEQFRAYVARVLLSAEHPERQRYLSKNNNNVLRVALLRNAFPKALIVVPFRHPEQQAASLLQQHRHFIARHSNDSFSWDYMAWLGHHEFGLTHRPFVFPGAVNAMPTTEGDTGDINYWLNIWISTYEYLFSRHASNVSFVCYEDLCDSKSKALERLHTLANIAPPTSASVESFAAPARKVIDGVCGRQLKRAMDLYADMRQRSGSVTHEAALLEPTCRTAGRHA